MPETTIKSVSDVVTTFGENIGGILKLALDTVGALLSNPYVLFFMSFGIVMWGVHLFHSIRKL